jgi:hypothetical protein
MWDRPPGSGERERRLPTVSGGSHEWTLPLISGDITAFRDGTEAVGAVSPDGDGLSGAAWAIFHACAASSSGLAWVSAATEAELTRLQVGDLMSHNDTV